MMKKDTIGSIATIVGYLVSGVILLHYCGWPIVIGLFIWTLTNDYETDLRWCNKIIKEIDQLLKKLNGIEK